MPEQDNLFYSFTPGIDVVPLGNGSVLLKSDTLEIRLEGKSASFFVEQVLPLLNGQNSLSKIVASLPQLSAGDLKYYLDDLVNAHVLRLAPVPLQPASPAEQILSPMLMMLDQQGMPAAKALEKLGKTRIAIFGLEGHGAQLAALLARTGIGTLVLVDPFQYQMANLALNPLLGQDAVGKPRQNALRAALEAQGSIAQIQTGPESEEVTSQGVAALAPECNLLVDCFDKGFSSIHHSINQASLTSGIPAIYSEAQSHIGFVGPLVLPGQTACYMCYRMRNIACADDFNQAMSYEEYLIRQKSPALHQRGVFPALLPYLASLLAIEILKNQLSLVVPTLASKVLEFDAFTLQTTTHHIIRDPDCPVCGVKKKSARRQPLIAELRQPDRPPGNLANDASKLVSRRTGIVKHLQRIEKDPSEPARPYIYRVESANFGFSEKEFKQESGVSGKGMTLDEARSSALGEAIEGYSGSRWDFNEVVYGRQDDLEGASLDPRRLVLYAPDQYPHLKYAPYQDDTRLGWVHARSLVTGNLVWVPALAVFMNYQGAADAERICPTTSNGLATGPTLLDAILKATQEVLERDAFMISWLDRLPGRRVSPYAHPQDEIVELCEAYQRRQVEMQLYLLPVDHPCHVFAALGVQQDNADGPAIMAGLGADLDPARAARQAILEVAQARPVLRRMLRHPDVSQRLKELVADPRRVSTMEVHELLYASASSSTAFNFIFSSPQTAFAWQPGPPESQADRLQRLVDHFSSKGGDLIYFNLTSPDMEEMGLYTARVIVPDFQPVDFGWKERRLGGERLYEFPQWMGFSTRRITQAELNPDPHPLA